MHSAILERKQRNLQQIADLRYFFVEKNSGKDVIFCPKCRQKIAVSGKDDFLAETAKKLKIAVPVETA